MPTIKQLPAATSVAATDLLPLSQGGTTKALAIGSLLSSVQTAISVAPSSLLGRVSATSGAPEIVAVGTGLAIAAGSVSATGADHIQLPISAGLKAGDEVVVNSDGLARRMPATSLRSLFTAGSGISIDGTGTVSAVGGAGFSGVSTFNARSGPITLTSTDLTAAGGALASSLPQGAMIVPLANGNATAGTSPSYARQDHVHPTDVGRLGAANNLSDLANASLARGNLGLGSAAVLNVGAAAGTVAAGDDSRITGALSAATAATTYASKANPTFTGLTTAQSLAVTNTFNVYRYTSAGVFIDEPFAISPETGMAYLNSGMTVAGSCTFNGNIEFGQPVHIATAAVLSLGYKTASRWGGADSWVEQVAGGALAYQTLAQIVSYPTNGIGAFSGAVRVSDIDAAVAAGAYTAGFGGVFVGYASADAISPSQVWGQYLLGHKHAANRQDFVVIETDMANEAPTVPINSYAIATGGVTAGHWIAAGGEIAQTGTTVYPASAAIGILSDCPTQAGARWDKGVVFDVNALASANQHGSANQVAVQFAMHHEVQWTFDASGSRGMFMRSDATAAGMGIVGIAGGINFVSENEVVVASLMATGVLSAATAMPGASTNQVATTAFVTAAVQGSGTVVTNASSYSMKSSDNFVIVRKGVGSSTAIVLPSSPDVWTPYVVKDGRGDASTNNITITGSAPIDGSSSFVLGAGFESVTLVFDGVYWSVI